MGLLCEIWWVRAEWPPVRERVPSLRNTGGGGGQCSQVRGSQGCGCGHLGVRRTDECWGSEARRREEEALWREGESECHGHAPVTDPRSSQAWHTQLSRADAEGWV